MDDRRVEFEIVEHLAVFRVTNGWTKELNLVSWNGHPAKYDIREWSRDYTMMSRGVTLTDAEMDALVNAVTAHRENNNEAVAG